MADKKRQQARNKKPVNHDPASGNPAEQEQTTEGTEQEQTAEGVEAKVEDTTEPSVADIDDQGRSGLAPEQERKSAGMRKLFPIVGIGASAGGLKAIEEFFAALTPDDARRMAFVVVQHLSPDHKSMLAELIGRRAPIEVHDIEDGVRVEPGGVYIIPPNYDLALMNGTLQLFEPSQPRGRRLPVDFFFRSLAQEQNEHAVGIIFSGTGRDGTLGVRAIKGAGGMIMAQTLDSAEFDGMPRAAINTGLVDFELRPDEMAGQLVDYINHSFANRGLQTIDTTQKVDDVLKKIFTLLRSETGHDFSEYKKTTIIRRIEQRMAVNKVEDVGHYLRFLRRDVGESEKLFRNLLIGVTRFFRDKESFTVLEQEAIPGILDDRKNGEDLRAWIVGCSTGEEAYSIAILVHEYLERTHKDIKVQIFATDIDSDAIAEARAGHYPASISHDVSPERLKKYFTKTSDSEDMYKVHKSIREMIIFSKQDLVRDPPFSRMDLVSCRNLLIYMNPALQKKMIPVLHYALKPRGFFFLGTSESLGDYRDVFETVDRKSKLFRRTNGDQLMRFPVMRIPPSADESQPDDETAKRRPEVVDTSKPPLRTLVERALLTHSALVGVLVDKHGDIQYLHGRSGLLLEPAEGEARMNVLRMAREGLERDLSVTLRRAVINNMPVHKHGLRVKSNGDYKIVNLTVQPLRVSPDYNVDSRLFLVILDRVPGSGTKADRKVNSADTDGLTDEQRKIKELREELQTKEEYLQSTLEEMQTANEELESSQEEMHSVNEELQSMNEELETSKEELQSLNEELATVNSELEEKVHDLERTNDDMNNLLASTGIGMIFVDHEQRIMRFTPTVTRVINLLEGDVGRPVGHIVSKLQGYDKLVDHVQYVLDTLEAKEIEVKTQDGVWFLLTIRPYRTRQNVIEGAVITFTDIEELKKGRNAMIEASELRRFAVVVRDSNDAIIMQDMNGRIRAWNAGAERMYGWSEKEAREMNFQDLVPEELREDFMKRIRKFAASESIQPLRDKRVARDGKQLEITLTATTLLNETGRPYAISTVERKLE